MTLVSESTEALEAELRRRKAVTPVPLLVADFAYLTKMVIEEVNNRARGIDEDNDFQHYVYEEAMKAVYGPDIFTKMTLGWWSRGRRR